MAKYFKDLWLGVTTVLAGMQVTFGHLFRKSITVQYPKETLPMFPRTRARLVNTIEDCGCCMKCARICPVDMIQVKGVRAGKDEDLGILPDGTEKKMHVVQFDMDFSKCLYCGLCVDSCDPGSLHWEQPQQISTFTREELYGDSVKIPHEERQELIRKDEIRKAEAAAARKAKAAAKKKAKPKADGDTPAKPEGAAPKPIAKTTEEKPAAIGKTEEETTKPKEVSAKGSTEEQTVTESKVEEKKPEIEEEKEKPDVEGETKTGENEG